MFSWLTQVYFLQYCQLVIHIFDLLKHKYCHSFQSKLILKIKTYFPFLCLLCYIEFDLTNWLLLHMFDLQKMYPPILIYSYQSPPLFTFFQMCACSSEKSGISRCVLLFSLKYVNCKTDVWEHRFINRHVLNANRPVLCHVKYTCCVHTFLRGKEDLMYDNKQF